MSKRPLNDLDEPNPKKFRPNDNFVDPNNLLNLRTQQMSLINPPEIFPSNQLLLVRINELENKFDNFSREVLSMMRDCLDQLILVNNRCLPIDAPTVVPPEIHWMPYII